MERSLMTGEASKVSEKLALRWRDRLLVQCLRGTHVAQVGARPGIAGIAMQIFTIDHLTT